MKAIRIEQPGGPEAMTLVDAPLPEPGSGEIRVRHAAVGLNFIDTYHRSGFYPLPMPAGLGLEAAGTVEAVGPRVERFSLGDRVAYMSGPPGAYAEAHVVAADRAVRVPDDVTFEDAAAALLKGLTTEYLVRRTFHVKHGDEILVHAAAGGVGQILCQWAASLGARVIGTVGSAEKAELAHAAGCSDVILSGEEDIVARVRTLTNGRGVDVAYDGVGAATAEASLNSLRRRGLFVSFGNASGPVAAIEPLRLTRAGSVYMTRPTTADYFTTAEELDDGAEALWSVLRSGAVKIAIGARYALDDVRAAHEALEARRTTGSTLLLP